MRQRSIRFAVVVVALNIAVLLGPLAPLGPAMADGSSTSSAALPSGRFGTSTAFDGRYAYVFGGDGCGGAFCDSIVRFDTVEERVATMGGKLPTPRKGTTAVWAGNAAYVFGGYDGSDLTDILRYDPASDSITKVGDLHAWATYGSAAWEGAHAYILGGFFSDRVQRFTPSTGELVTLGETLPTGRHYTASVALGGKIYVFGGFDGAELDEVVVYEPASGSMTTLSAKLPTGRHAMAAFTDGLNAFAAGGERNCEGGGGCVRYRDIHRLDPSTGALDRMAASLPAARSYLNAAADSSGAWLIGGLGCSSGGCASIYRYSLAPDAPQSVTATAGPGEGEITVAFDAPAANSYSGPLLGYRVLRASPGSPEVLAGETPSSPFVDAPPGTGPYSYRVSAVSRAGEGDRSAATAMVAPAPPDARPGAPRDLRVRSAPGEGNALLEWLPPAGAPAESAVTEYRVYRSRGSGPFERIGTVPVAGLANPNEPRYEDAGLQAGATYTYLVATAAPTGEGEASNPATIRPGRTGYVFIHGVCSNAEGTWLQPGRGRFLYDAVAAGSPTTAISYHPATTPTLDAIEARLVDGLDAFISNDPGIERIVVIGHSLGGLLARRLLDSDAEAWIDRVVTLDSPDLGLSDVTVTTLDVVCPRGEGDEAWDVLIRRYLAAESPESDWLAELPDDDRVTRLLYVACHSEAYRVAETVVYGAGSCHDDYPFGGGMDETFARWDDAILLGAAASYNEENPVFFETAHASACAPRAREDDFPHTPRSSVIFTGHGVGSPLSNLHGFGTSIFATYIAHVVKTADETWPTHPDESFAACERA